MTKSKEYKCYGGFIIKGSYLRTHELTDISMKIVEDKIKEFGQDISIEFEKEKDSSAWSVSFQREFMQIPDLKLCNNIVLMHRDDKTSRMTIVVKPEDFVVRKISAKYTKKVWRMSIKVANGVFMIIGHFNTREQLESCLEICREGGKQTLKIGDWYNPWSTEVVNFPMEYYFLDKTPTIKWNGIIPKDEYVVDLSTDVVYDNAFVYQ